MATAVSDDVAAPPARATEHFLALDGLRGVAAIAVVCLHWFEGLGNSWFSGARLAVDFFFLLSGFVMDHAYRDRLERGLGFGRFFLLRVIRLWPMIAAGAAIGLLRVVARGVLDHDTAFSLTDALAKFGINLILLPDFFSGLYADKFPLNIAMWSLLAEFVAYAVFARFTFRAGIGVLCAIAAVTGIAVVTWTTFYFGAVHSGVRLPGLDYVFDFSRAIFSFTLGMLIYRLRDRVRFDPGLHLWAYAALLMLAFVLPEPVLPAALRLGMVLCLFPAVLLFASRLVLEGATAQAATFLGDISYPLYAIHTPLIWLIGGALGLMDHDIPELMLGIAAIPMTIVAAYFLLRFYDEPLRRYLGRLYRRSQSPNPAS